jgi:hypothetical protein
MLELAQFIGYVVLTPIVAVLGIICLAIAILMAFVVYKALNGIVDAFANWIWEGSEFLPNEFKDVGYTDWSTERKPAAPLTPLKMDPSKMTPAPFHELVKDEKV